MFGRLTEKLGVSRTPRPTHPSEVDHSTNAVELDNVEIVYNDHFLAVQGVSLDVPRGDIVALMGPNGAGKSSILKMISGIGLLERGEVTRGTIRVNGQEATNATTEDMVARGVTYILEGRRIFEDLTVEKNLRCGLYRSGKRLFADRSDFDRAFEYFPQLEELLDKKAGYLSGGQQQMLVIARGLLHMPDILLLDEPSLGLAPKLVDDIFNRVEEINDKEDLTMIIADQNARQLLNMADYGYVLENGQVEFHGTASELQNREEIKEFYLGTRDDDRYSEIKHYQIRKRWS